MQTATPKLLLSLFSLLFFTGSYAAKMDNTKREFIAPKEQLIQYNAIMIGDISINYLKQPSNNKYQMQRDLNYPMSEQRLAELKKDISQMVTKAFTKNSRFSKADQAGKGVLKINIALKDVQITTPTLDQKTQPGLQIHTKTPIYVTLESEFKDALNGELVAKFRKKRVNSNRFNYFYPSSKNRDDFEIRKLIRHWSNRMQKKIDQAMAAN